MEAIILLATIAAVAVGVLAGWRSRWRAMAVAGLVIAGLAAMPVVTLLGCIAADEYGPWFSLYSVFVIGTIAAVVVVLGMLVTAITSHGRRPAGEAPQRPARALIVLQMLVLLAQLGVVFWMLSETVPTA